MRRWSLGWALAACAIAAVGCGGGASKAPTASGAAKGVYGQYYYLAVAPAVGGTIASGDGLIACQPSGTGCGDATYHQTKYAWGAPVTLTATALPGFAFQSWGGDCSGTSPTCSLNGTSAGTDYTVVAVFKNLSDPLPPVTEVEDRLYGFVKNGASGVSGLTVTAVDEADASKVFNAEVTTTASGYFFLDLPAATYTLKIGSTVAATGVVLPNRWLPVAVQGATPTQNPACIPSMIPVGSSEGPSGCLVRQDLATTLSSPTPAVAAVVSGAKYNAGFATSVQLTCDYNGTATSPTFTWSQTGGPTKITLTGQNPSFTTPSVQDIVAATKAAFDCNALPGDNSDQVCKPTAVCPQGAGKGVGCGVSNFAFENRPRFMSINRQQAGELTYTFKCTVKDGTNTQSASTTVQLAGPVNSNPGGGIDSTNTLGGNNTYVPLGAIVVLDDDPNRVAKTWTVSTSTTGATIPVVNGSGQGAWFQVPVAGPSGSATSISYTAQIDGAAKTVAIGGITKPAATGGSSVATVTLTGHGYATNDLVTVTPNSADRVTATTPGSFGMGQFKITVVDADHFTYDDGVKGPAAGVATTGTASVQDITLGATLGLRVNLWTGAFNPAAPNTKTGSCGQCHQPTTPGGSVGLSSSAPTTQWNAWLGSKHNHIVIDGFAAGDYSSRCIACHSLGYNADPNADMGGWSKVATANSYAIPETTFVGQGCDVANPPAGCDQLAFKDMPAAVQQLSNVQCESCHGAATRTAHTVPLSSDACGYCHDSGTNGKGKHSIFSQWNQSGHRNLATAIGEGPDRGGVQNHCARCHYAQGYIAYVPQLLAGTPGNLVKPIQGLTRNNVEAITCATCHDPHDLKLRLEAPAGALALPSGYSVQNAGAGTLCASCHNTRNGAHGDSAAMTSGSGPHEAAQADVYFGKNAYLFGTTPAIAANVHMEAGWFGDTCAECHVKRIPAGFSTVANHWFDANYSCEVCHGTGGVTSDGKPLKGAAVMNATELKLEDLAAKFAATLNAKFAGVSGATLTTTVDAPLVSVTVPVTSISKVVPTAIHGSMGFIVTMGGTDYPVTLGGFAIGSATPLAVATATPGGNFAKALWNYLLIEQDKSLGVHNMPFVSAVLDASLNADLSIP